jgi:DNA-binding NtrC family response regulator
MNADEADNTIPFTGHFIIAGDGLTARTRNRYNPTHEEITKHFNVSQTEAAKLLNISRSKLKMLCRQYGVKNWPYRQVLFHSLLFTTAS